MIGTILTILGILGAISGSGSGGERHGGRPRHAPPSGAPYGPLHARHACPPSPYACDASDLGGPVHDRNGNHLYTLPRGGHGVVHDNFGNPIGCI